MSKTPKPKQEPTGGGEPPKNLGGRPTVFSRDKAESIIEQLEAGNFVEVACAFSGIHKDTFYAWVKRGVAETDRRESAKPLDQLSASLRDKEVARRLAEDPYVWFSDAVKKAKAQAQIQLLATIRGASKEAWQAAAWILERMDPDKWGAQRKVKVEISAEVRKQLESGLDRLEDAVKDGKLEPSVYELVLEIFAGIGSDDAVGNSTG